MNSNVALLNVIRVSFSVEGNGILREPDWNEWEEYRENRRERRKRCAGTHVFSKVASLVGMLRNRLLSSSSFPSYFFEEEEEGRVKHRGPEIFHGNMEPNTKEGETKEAERAKKKKEKTQEGTSADEEGLGKWFLPLILNCWNTQPLRPSSSLMMVLPEDLGEKKKRTDRTSGVELVRNQTRSISGNKKEKGAPVDWQPQHLFSTTTKHLTEGRKKRSNNSPLLFGLQVSKSEWFSSISGVCLVPPRQ